MEMEAGKLFIGGISWDTSEDRLREYFQAFGEVIEAVIMKDRTTGRGRGFGFIVFANAAVAEIVVREMHIIDGRKVEAKKAVPRDEHQNLNKNNGSNSIQGSPVHTRTKKIFVGGLASTVTETDFKNYFDQFGTITDVVVMYDHNTQRPRGFGFITYDSEEAVDKVLFKTFHELNGKMVEVKRAVPKELSPAPLRSPSNFGLNRLTSLLSPGYNLNSLGGYGMRTEGPFSPFTVGRNGYGPQIQYSPSNQHSLGLNLDSGFSLNYGVSKDPYVNGMNSYYSGNSNSRQYGNPNPNGGSGSLFANSNQSMWGNGNGNGNHTYGVNAANSNDFVVGSFGSIGEIWGNSPYSGKGDSLSSSNSVYGNGYNNFGGRGGNMRNNGGTSGSTSLYSVPNNFNEGGFSNLYEASFKGDHAWRSSPSSELLESSAFGYGRGNASANVASNSSAGGYGITASDRSNRGIAA